MRKLILTCFTIAQFASYVCAQSEKSIESTNGVVFSGDWDFEIDYSNKNVHIFGDVVENLNTTKKNGTLKLRLYLTEKEYSGGDMNGYVLADFLLGQLEGGGYYQNLDEVINLKTTPPNGTY